MLITPCAVLVIQNGKTRLVNIKNQDTMTKILDMIPDVMDKFSEKKEGKLTEEDVVAMAQPFYAIKGVREKMENFGEADFAYSYDDKNSSVSRLW